MATRAQQYNSRAKSLGDLLVLLEKQTGWHLAADDEHVVFGDDQSQPYVSGTHPTVPTSIDHLDTAIDYLNELKTQFNLHIADTTYHTLEDTDNGVTASDATDLSSANTLATEIKTNFNLHIAGSLGGAHTHSIPAHTHDLYLKEADVVDGATTRVNAGADLLGANTGGDLVVTGIDVDDETHGGIRGTDEGATGSGGGAGANSYHSPSGDNINTILSADATTLATLLTLTLELVIKYNRHLYVGALRMDEAV